MFYVNLPDKDTPRRDPAIPLILIIQVSDIGIIRVSYIALTLIDGDGYTLYIDSIRIVGIADGSQLCFKY
jgi:hypothetical protein